MAIRYRRGYKTTRRIQNFVGISIFRCFPWIFVVFAFFHGFALFFEVYCACISRGCLWFRVGFRVLLRGYLVVLRGFSLDFVEFSWVACGISSHDFSCF